MPVIDEFVDKLDNGNGFTGGQLAVQNVDFAKVSRAIYVGATATVVLTALDGSTITLTGATVGSFHNVRATKMTSATANILALW